MTPTQRGPLLVVSSFAEPRSLWSFRHLVWSSALADFRHYYAGSTLGAFWNVLVPRLLLGLYTFIFSDILHPQLGDSVPAAFFPLYVSSGFIPWGVFADCVTRGGNAFVGNTLYLKKMPIPEAVFVAQTAVSSTLSLFVSAGLLLGLDLAAAAGRGAPLAMVRIWSGAHPEHTDRVLPGP